MSSIPYFFDRVQESSTTTGTGTYTLAGAITGFQAFSALGDGNSCYYCAQEVDANGNPSGGWEVGIGTYTSAGTTLSRDTILASTNSNNAVNWAAGTRRIFLTIPAARSVTGLDYTIGSITKRPKFLNVNGASLNTGDNDLYTVPSGRRAVLGATSVFNQSAGNIVFFFQVKVSGTYYRLIGNTTCAAGFSTTANPHCVLEAGDILSINSATNNGLNVFMEICEFDATSPVTQGRVLGCASGNNTIYTCPTGRTALLMPVASALGILGLGVNKSFFVSDGSSRTINWYLVPNGGSPGNSNKLVVQGTAAASTRTVGPGGGFTMAAGDTLIINVNVGNAAQWASALVVEI